MIQTTMPSLSSPAFGCGEGLPAAWSPSGGHFFRSIDVRPSGISWFVEADAFERLVFVRGADAERHARRLAAAVAGEGQDVFVRIAGQDGWLVATLTYRAFRAGERPRPPIEEVRAEPGSALTVRTESVSTNRNSTA